MNLLLVSLCLIAVASAAPSENSDKLAAIRALPALEHSEIHDESGQYELRYVTAEGTIVTERGRLVPSPDGNGLVLVTEGEVSYVGDDGRTYVTKYSAGLDGVKMEGAHLPVAPEPIPVEVVASP
ncbi:larval cuticle protein 65Ag1-like [Maniola jurtina]|uniref:larval cuticle protein 65Ag1-like n=1 Tax=Maniola jurtina TaxID=191418 RepID=UPI001E68E494|nr:larval cuticle protein 65Ag1-like [Maniola jurtina]